jgi:hypothetical protein
MKARQYGSDGGVVGSVQLPVQLYNEIRRSTGHRRRIFPAGSNPSSTVRSPQTSDTGCSAEVIRDACEDSTLPTAVWPPQSVTGPVAQSRRCRDASYEAVDNLLVWWRRREEALDILQLKSHPLHSDVVKILTEGFISRIFVSWYGERN